MPPGIALGLKRRTSQSSSPASKARWGPHLLAAEAVASAKKSKVFGVLNSVGKKLSMGYTWK